MHYGIRRRHRAASRSMLQSKRPKHRGIQDTIAGVISEDVKQIVFAAMQKLPPEQRIVLTMRCYELLNFPQIAEQLGYREFRARTVFSRAKKSLGRNLARNGLGKESLEGALLVFGKMTATSEASAAGVSVAGVTQSLTQSLTQRTLDSQMGL